ncbi:partial Glutathione transport system permease protein GsiD, partial [Anaerolineae bacterium]
MQTDLLEPFRLGKAVEAVAPSMPAGWHKVLRRAWSNRTGTLGAFILLAVLVCAVFAPWLAPRDPTDIDLSARLKPPAWFAGGTDSHPFGTDDLGRDVLSRTLFGARVSLLVGAISMLVAGTLGVILGLISGYRGGKTDSIIMSLADIQQSFPVSALAIAVVAVLGAGTRNTILVLGIGGWTLFARVVRGEVLSVREKEFVEAARSVGVRDLRIMFRHILPNIISPIIVIGSFTFSLMIVVEASLSFIGLGIQPPESSWGLMLSEARNFLELAWWLPTFPGIAILVTVLGANL